MSSFLRNTSPVPAKLTLLAAALAVFVAACSRDQAPPVAAAPEPAPVPAQPAAATPPAADAQMQAVLDQLATLGAKPLETLTPEQARAQPSPADAVGAVLKAQGKPTAQEVVAKVQDSTFPGPAGPVDIRIYTPAQSGPEASDPMPVILWRREHGPGKHSSGPGTPTVDA